MFGQFVFIDNLAKRRDSLLPNSTVLPPKGWFNAMLFGIEMWIRGKCLCPVGWSGLVCWANKETANLKSTLVCLLCLLLNHFSILFVCQLSGNQSKDLDRGCQRHPATHISGYSPCLLRLTKLPTQDLEAEAGDAKCPPPPPSFGIVGIVQHLRQRPVSTIHIQTLLSFSCFFNMWHFRILFGLHCQSLSHELQVMSQLSCRFCPILGILVFPIIVSIEMSLLALALQLLCIKKIQKMSL